MDTAELALSLLNGWDATLGSGYEKNSGLRESLPEILNLRSTRRFGF